MIHIKILSAVRLECPNDLSIIPHLISDLSDSVTPWVGEKPVLPMC